MGSESQPSPSSAPRGKLDPSATEPAAPAQKKPDASTVDLITFQPPNVEGVLPAGKDDLAELVRRRIRRWIAALGVLALVCAVVLLGPGLYRGFKAWRATALALQGEELVRKNQINEAILTIHSAFILSPDAPEVLRAMAQVLTTLNVSGAMTYWNWVLQTRDATDDDRRAAIACAMQNDLYNEASTLIQDLLTRDGGDARNQLLAARWCAQRGSPAQTMYYATRAVNDDPASKPALLFLATQELANNYLHQEGVDSLFRLAEADDDTGLLALQQLALDSNLKPGEIDRLTARLRSHPLAGEPEHLAALALEIKLHPDRREILVDQAVAAHQKAAPADLADFAEWLATHGEAARVLQLISSETALSDKDIFSSYIDALGQLKHWAELRALLTGATVPIEFPYVELYLSRAAHEMGDDQGSELHWQKAVAAAANNPVQSLHLAVYAEKLGQNERAAAIYRALTQEPLTSRIAYLGLMRVLSDKDARTLRDILEQAVARWPKDDHLVGQYVFLNLLLNEHVPEMRQRALDLLADDTYSVAHRTNAALACLRLNDPAGALEIYRRFPIDWHGAPATDLVVYAAVLNANGQAQAAHKLLLPVNRRALRPELRDLIKSVP